MSNENLGAFSRATAGTVTRRALVSGAVGLGALAALAACTGTGGAPATESKTLTFGSGSSDDVPKRAYAAVVDAFMKKSGDKVTTNTVAHNDFQNNINTYLQGSPDDVFTWFAGYRMRFYAAKDLVAPIDDVWKKIGSGFSAGLQQASTCDDGKKYFVPNYN